MNPRSDDSDAFPSSPDPKNTLQIPPTAPSPPSPLQSLQESTSSSSRSTASFRQHSSDPVQPPSIQAHYYAGLPSRPLLLASTRPDALLAPPSSRFAVQKHLYPIALDHSICSVWDKTIAPFVMRLIDSHYTDGGVCIDAVRIGYNQEDAITTIWIGLPRNALSPQLAGTIVKAIKDFSLAKGADQFEVEMRSTSVEQLSKLIDPDDLNAQLYRLADPFCLTLGTPISTANDPHYIGTGGIFISLPNHDHLFMVTAQHVVSHDGNAERSPFSDQAPISIRLDVPKRFLERQREVEQKIADSAAMIALTESRIDQARQKDRDCSRLEENHQFLTKSHSVLKEWSRRLDTEFGNESLRTFAHAFAFPPRRYNVGGAEDNSQSASGYTEDWAVVATDVELDESNVNSIRLTDDEDRTLARRYPDQKPQLDDNVLDSLKVTGFLSEEELATGSFAVLMRGASSSLRLGVTNGVKSYVRIDSGQIRQWSKEVSILNLSESGRYSYAGQFSKEGDSGATVVDRMGRICGVLTSGANQDEKVPIEEGSREFKAVDVTYVTPWWWIVERMRAFGLEPTVV